MTVSEPSAPRPSGSEPALGPHILVVDDEPSLRQVATRILRGEGFVVYEAEDGIHALEFIRRGEVLLDVVVTDIVMPRLNGIELLQALANLHPELPVLLMSGHGMTELEQRGIAVPCAVLNKPFPPERLVAEVLRCLGERRR